jgi:hypothetical protein
MKIKNLLILIAALTSSYATAVECDLRVQALDLRDGGLRVQQEEVYLSSPRDKGDCNLIVSATALSNPRSKAVQEFPGVTYKSFVQRIVVSDISLSGEGSLKIMSFDFSANNFIYRLNLRIYPGPIPNGVAVASSYTLVGEWSILVEDGTVFSERTAFVQTINTSDNVSINWQDFQGWNSRIALDLKINNAIVPIHTFQLNDPNPNYLNQPFYLASRTIGSLSATSLVPGTSMTVSAPVSCILQESNQNACN